MRIRIETDVENKERESLLNEEWYHQRFDGCPYLLAYILVAETKKEIRKGTGYAEVRCCFFHNHRCDWYILEKDNKRTTDWFVGESKRDLEFTKKLINQWEKDEKKYYEMFKKVENTSLSKLSNEELKKLHDEYYESGINAFSGSSIIDGFALGSDNIVADKIHLHLKSIGRGKEYNKIFSVLTAPIYLSFENEAEISLLKIVKDCINKENWKEDSNIIEKINEHQKNYFWIHNNYVDDIVLDTEFFVKEIENRLDKGNSTETLEHLEEHSRVKREEKRKLINGIDLPEDIQALLLYSEDFTKWQDGRKKMTFFNTNYSLKILEEIGKRFTFSLEDLKMLTPPEIDLIFEGKITKEDIEKRKENLMISWRAEDAYTITGEMAKEMHEKFAELDVPDDISILKGLCASMGLVRGKVKIVKSAKEIGKVEPGDILVAVMTRPDYVMAMRKAGAIVTDEGGVTCHAAIVSRELKIPCVIGTKFATRVLKDGQLVEVNADNGEVKILEE